LLCVKFFNQFLESLKVAFFFDLHEFLLSNLLDENSFVLSIFDSSWNVLDQESQREPNQHEAMLNSYNNQ
jgi:hypothetical protein